MFVKLTHSRTGEIQARGVYRKVDIRLTDPSRYPALMLVVPDSWFSHHDSADLRRAEAFDSVFIRYMDVLPDEIEEAA